MVLVLRKERERLFEKHQTCSHFITSVDQLVYDTITNFDPNERFYNPLHLQDNLGALAKSVQKSLSLRTRIQELDDKAFRALIELETFEKNMKILQDLEIAPWRRAELSTYSEGLNLAAELYDDASQEHPLSQAMGREAAIESELSANRVISHDNASKLISSKWTNLGELNDLVKQALEDPGNATNYGDQAQRLKNILREELVTLHWRARAVSDGVKTLFGVEESWEIPQHEDPKNEQKGLESFLDSIAQWARKIARVASSKQQFRKSVPISVPLVEQTPQGKMLLINNRSGQDYKKAMNTNGKITFSLKNKNPYPGRRASMDALSIEFDVRTRLRERGPIRVPFKLELPLDPVLLEWGCDPALSQTSAFAVSNDVIKLATWSDGGVNLRNFDPFHGDWTVTVDEKLIYTRSLIPLKRTASSLENILVSLTVTYFN